MNESRAWGPTEILLRPLRMPPGGLRTILVHVIGFLLLFAFRDLRPELERLCISVYIGGTKWDPANISQPRPPACAWGGGGRGARGQKIAFEYNGRNRCGEFVEPAATTSKSGPVYPLWVPPEVNGPSPSLRRPSNRRFAPVRAGMPSRAVGISFA